MYFFLHAYMEVCVEVALGVFHLTLGFGDLQIIGQAKRIWRHRWDQTRVLSDTGWHFHSLGYGNQAVTSFKNLNKIEIHIPYFRE